MRPVLLDIGRGCRELNHAEDESYPSRGARSRVKEIRRDRTANRLSEL
jgi:hypothetical protein